MDHTADDFATFFNDKVASVRASTAAKPLFDVAQKTTPTLSEWSTVTVDEIDKLIRFALNNKTCQLDPVPTWLLKEVRGIASPFIALLFNKSLATVYFPSAFQQAVVCLLLKKSDLDASELTNTARVEFVVSLLSY